MARLRQDGRRRRICACVRASGYACARAGWYPGTVSRNVCDGDVRRKINTSCKEVVTYIYVLNFLMTALLNLASTRLQHPAQVPPFPTGGDISWETYRGSTIHTQVRANITPERRAAARHTCGWAQRNGRRAEGIGGDKLAQGRGREQDETRTPHSRVPRPGGIDEDFSFVGRKRME